MNSQFFPAIDNPIEQYEISELLDNLGDRKAFKTYVETAVARDRKRGKYMKAPEKAFFRKRKAARFPTPDADWEKWANIIGTKVLSAVAELGSDPVVERIFYWLRPIISIATMSDDGTALPLGASKFGGRPDVGENFEWPTCELGPLGFLGQINFTEIFGSVATYFYGLPRRGHLLLFAYDGMEDAMQPGRLWQGDDQWREIKGMTQAVYVPWDQSLASAEPPANMDEGNAIKPCCPLRMEDALDLPRPHDTGEQCMVDHYDLICDLRDQINQGMHWLMGYPVHSRTSNTSPGPNWFSLITLDSDDRLYWNRSDGEHLDVYVHWDSLEDRLFKDVYGYAS